MTSATTTKPEQTQSSQDAPGAFERLSTLSRRLPSLQSYHQASVRIIAEHFAAPFAMIHVSNGTTTFEDAVELAPNARAVWHKVTQASQLEAQASGKALARLYTVDATNTSVAVLAVPIRLPAQGASGAIALVTPCESRSAAEKCLFEIESVVAFFSASLPDPHAGSGHAASSEEPIQRALAKATEFSGLAELAFALTNGLKSKFSCNQVVLGLAAGKAVKILSISEMDDIYPRSPGSNQIRQAMEECLDANAIVRVSATGSQESQADYRLHSQWSAAIGYATVASVPLHLNEKCIGVLSLTRPQGSDFSAEEMTSIAAAVRSYVPAIHLVARSSRSLAAHAKDSARAALHGLIEPGRIGRKIALALFVGFAAWFCFGEVPYRVSTPCTIAANQLQNMTAPFPGAIAEAHVSVGDSVTAGQLLYRMETDSLRLQQSELEADAAVAKLEAAQAVAGEDLDAAALANAELHVIRAKLDALQHQLQVAEVRAPCDGIIMAGEIATRVGELVPMGESLIQFAPQDARRVDLQIPEDQVLHLKAGSVGSFAALARPGESLPITIERIDPASQMIEQDNVFIASGTLTQTPSWMRVGMQGAATIDAGSKKVHWVALHRIIDFIRLHSGL